MEAGEACHNALEALPGGTERIPQAQADEGNGEAAEDALEAEAEAPGKAGPGGMPSEAAERDTAGTRSARRPNREKQVHRQSM